MIPPGNPPPGYRIKWAKTLQDDCRVTEDSVVTETRYLYEYERIPGSLDRRRAWGAVGLVFCGFLYGLWLGWMIWGRHT